MYPKLQTICLLLVVTCAHQVSAQQTLLVVKQKELYGYANSRGELVIKPQFQLAKPFSEELASVSVCTDGGWRWGFINESGTFITEARFYDSKSFREGLAGVKLGDKWGFINKKGEITINPTLDDEYGLTLSSGKAFPP